MMTLIRNAAGTVIYDRHGAAPKPGRNSIPTCGAPCPERQTYPNGRRAPAKKCNRSHGHDGPHRVYDRRTFQVIFEWAAGR